MKNILDCIIKPNWVPNFKCHICSKLEAVVGRYSVSGAGNPNEVIYPIYYDSKIPLDDVVSETNENKVAYYLTEHNMMFVLAPFLEQLITDTFEYSISYIPVSDFDSEEFCVDTEKELPLFFSTVNWIDDDFMNYEDAEFDFVAFCKIDDGIHYLNPKHFSVQQLIDYMHYFLTANR